jgi:hypothetical protein
MNILDENILDSTIENFLDESDSLRHRHAVNTQ